MIVPQLMSCDREFSHGILTHPFFRKVGRDEAIEDEVAVCARSVGLADEVISIDMPRSRSSEKPVAASIISE